MFKSNKCFIKNMKREFEHIKSKSMILEEGEDFIMMRTPNSLCKNCNKYVEMFFISFPITTMCYECGYSYYGLPILKQKDKG